MLLGHGANISDADDDGDTALHLAARYGKEEVVKVLLNTGAIISVKNAPRDTPLHLAAGYGYKRVVEV